MCWSQLCHVLVTALSCVGHSYVMCWSQFCHVLVTVLSHCHILQDRIDSLVAKADSFTQEEHFDADGIQSKQKALVTRYDALQVGGYPVPMTFVLPIDRDWIADIVRGNRLITVHPFLVLAAALRVP